MTLKIECAPEQVVQATTDRRGRFTLGSDYANEDVTVLVVSTGDD